MLLVHFELSPCGDVGVLWLSQKQRLVGRVLRDWVWLNKLRPLRYITV